MTFAIRSNVSQYRIVAGTPTAFSTTTGGKDELRSPLPESERVSALEPIEANAPRLRVGIQDGKLRLCFRLGQHVLPADVRGANENNMSGPAPARRYAIS